MIWNLRCQETKDAYVCLSAREDTSYHQVRACVRVCVCVEHLNRCKTSTLKNFGHFWTLVECIFPLGTFVSDVSVRI